IVTGDDQAGAPLAEIYWMPFWQHAECSVGEPGCPNSKSPVQPGPVILPCHGSRDLGIRRSTYATLQGAAQLVGYMRWRGANSHGPVDDQYLEIIEDAGRPIP